MMEQKHPRPMTQRTCIQWILRVRVRVQTSGLLTLFSPETLWQLTGVKLEKNPKREARAEEVDVFTRKIQVTMLLRFAHCSGSLC